VLHLGDISLTAWPYARRRAALENLFTEHALHAPLTLPPSTTDPDTARQWLDCRAAGLAGLVFKAPGRQVYGRSESLDEVQGARHDRSTR
jgi:ATP-dependent DNA ligase